jgi:hypothetical protein
MALFRPSVPRTRFFSRQNHQNFFSTKNPVFGSQLRFLFFKKFSRVRGGGIVYIFKLSAHAEQKAREIQIFFGKAYKRDFAGTGCRGVGVLFARFVK